MDREGFRNRMKQYKEARGLNPLLKYWEWKAQPAEKDIPKYGGGTGNVGEWDPRITAEGYDDEGYYAQAMNPLPEVTVVGSKTRSRSERPIQYSYVNGYPESTTWTTDYNPGAGALERVYPEFELLTGVRAISTLPTKAEKLGRVLLNSDIVTPQISIQPNNIVYRLPIKEKAKTISYGKAKTLANDLVTGTPYENIMGKIVSVDRGPWKSKIGVTGDLFGKYIGNGSESTVFMANDDPNFVYKILTTNVSTPLDAKDYLSMIYSNRNKVPAALQHKLVGFVKNGKGFNPVMRLKRVSVLDQKDNKTLLEKALPQIDKKMNRSGYNRYADTQYFNDKNNIEILDIKPENVGQLENGNYTLLDFIYLLRAEQIPIKSIASDIFSKWGKSYAEGGEVTGPPTYEDWLKALIKNNLWMHPDYYMSHSLNTATKALKLASAKLPGREDMPPVPAPAEIKGEFPQEWVMNNLYNVENPRKKGVTKKYAKMYDSRTLGAGVDVVSGHPELYDKAKRFGIEKELADEIAYEHIVHDDQVIRDNYADIYGKAAADTLSFGPRFLVAQARYQLGNVRKGWDEIHKALAKGDAKALKKAVLKVTPEDHDYRKKWVKNFNVYGNEPE